MGNGICPFDMKYCTNMWLVQVAALTYRVRCPGFGQEASNMDACVSPVQLHDKSSLIFESEHQIREVLRALSRKDLGSSALSSLFPCHASREDVAVPTFRRRGMPLLQLRCHSQPARDTTGQYHSPRPCRRS